MLVEALLRTYLSSKESYEWSIRCIICRMHLNGNRPEGLFRQKNNKKNKNKLLGEHEITCALFVRRKTGTLDMECKNENFCSTDSSLCSKPLHRTLRRYETAIWRHNSKISLILELVFTMQLNHWFQLIWIRIWYSWCVTKRLQIKNNKCSNNVVI